MRKTGTVALSLVALALPTANAWAAAKTTAAKTTIKKRVVVATKTFTGSAAEADRWGPLQVTIVVRKTTTTIGTRKTVRRKITSVHVPVYPNHTDRSVFINQQALPTLVQETLQAQSAHIYVVSGATNSSDAFAQSLQSAILKEKAW
ncbi:MAG: FMN-binding protein [Gaiellaceae bacterium]